MATATPAAPSPSAAPTQGTQPAPASPVAPGVPDAAPSPAAPPAPRKAKPIPSLPGVIPESDPADTFGLPPSAERSRGADGRFLPGQQSDAADHTQEAAEAPAPARFKFAGEEFASQEAAEQNFRSMRGQFRPIAQLAKELGGMDKVAPTLQRAADSARSWKAQHDAVYAELQALKAGQSAPAEPTPTTGEADADTIDDGGVDWSLYAEIQKLAHEQGEPWKAEQWLISETQKAERARFERMLEERLAPYDRERQRAGVVSQTEALFGQLAEYAYPDGSPAFPELHDETAAYEIGALWAKLGLPREAAMTPQGAAAAIALYRMQRAGRPLPTPAQTAAPTAPPPSSAPTDAPAAAGIADGRTPQLGLPSQGGPSAEAARILAGLRSANVGNRSVLGFDA